MPIPFPIAIELTDEERAQLEAWSRRRTSAQGLAMQARIVPTAAEGLNTTEIADRLEIAVSSARKQRNRFAAYRSYGEVFVKSAADERDRWPWLLSVVRGAGGGRAARALQAHMRGLATS